MVWSQVGSDLRHGLLDLYGLRDDNRPASDVLLPFRGQALRISECHGVYRQ